MFVNYENVCVDSSYSVGNPVKVDLAGGDVLIYQTQPGEVKSELRDVHRGQVCIVRY
jgi:hypothetical protein